MPASLTLAFFCLCATCSRGPIHCATRMARRDSPPGASLLSFGNSRGLFSCRRAVANGKYRHQQVTDGSSQSVVICQHFLLCLVASTHPLTTRWLRTWRCQDSQGRRQHSWPAQQTRPPARCSTSEVKRSRAFVRSHSISSAATSTCRSKHKASGRQACTFSLLIRTCPTDTHTSSPGSALVARISHYLWSEQDLANLVRQRQSCAIRILYTCSMICQRQS